MDDVRTGDKENISTDYHAWVVEELKNTYAEQLAGNGDNIVLKAVIGIPSTEILRYARQENVDLIIMRPTPVPRLPLVVKNPEKSWSRTSLARPGPLSRTS